MRIKPLPSVQELSERYEYDSKTGRLVSRIAGRKKKIGREVGYVGNKGYRRVSIGGCRYCVHRIVWKMHYGVDPPLLLDHINGVRDDNRIENLREANFSENTANSKCRETAEIKLKGVSRNNKGFSARIWKDYKVKRLGTFKSPEEAHQRYVEEAKRIFGEFANDGRNENRP